ncbi:ATP-binding protein [Actinomadura syzygii]|uniref:ATP-binding protein n=1 Tax=Actinomadura syzygii TaxID=1427538 RepID=UPI001651CAF4|nr:ATP-binding protein [Actinomadura syzygii]
MIVWTEVFGGRVRADVREVRGRVRRALDGCAGSFDLGDVELMVSEVATNAVRHTASGRAGGVLWVSVLVSAERVRVEIRDDGGAEGRPVIPPQGRAGASAGGA